MTTSEPLHKTVTLATVHSFLSRQTASTSNGAEVVSYIHNRGDQGPVLWLVHGYPQSAFIFRHLALLLKDHVSLFIPELPGYGISTSPSKTKTSFRALGASLTEAFHDAFPDRKRPVILAGHDRGARICHRLAVDHAHPPSGTQSQPLSLQGLILLDIVPTLVQWQVFANPLASTAYWHWPFLASPLAADMIEAYGGDKWVLAAFERIGGSNPRGTEMFKANDAWGVYSSQFKERSAIEGSCADYTAAAHVEPGLQEEDQKAGRKIKVPTVVMWSLEKLGKMHGDVGEIWEGWMADEKLLQAQGCGEEVGHYLPEEASEVVGERIKEFLVDLKA